MENSTLTPSISDKLEVYQKWHGLKIQENRT
jgi:hypothetical protein